MTVQIREIVLRVDMTDEPGTRERQSGGTPYEDRQLLVQECVDKVLKVLKKKNSR